MTAMERLRDVSRQISELGLKYAMGESPCQLTVLDVADVLQARHAYVSGGKSPAGCPILTFPDITSITEELSEDDYQSLVSYLTSIPALEDIDAGFVVVIDRRQDRWTAVKNLLLRISGFFPGLVQQVYVLKPSSFLQRNLADVGFKFVRDDFKFKVLMCGSADELHKSIPVDQLTFDLGGSLEYDHSEWVQHRAFDLWSSFVASFIAVLTIQFIIHAVVKGIQLVAKGYPLRDNPRYLAYRHLALPASLSALGCTEAVLRLY
ncbi:hypothetical protein CAPTEDRAFT_216297 [Capitella teleta]|uniref:CRAL-TRIO domain-containing protein n=1 Tax=Capitella teleta TaxID=283909 RepID=R7UD41_CAPTE|nr:hypothetical protein CAPTEDRAFT_216297 [Capitella teleta]|eukprot:ELU03899.1 hypothetical protein CAPTEDRAFT_216297 [Capitella teleta]